MSFLEEPQNPEEETPEEMEEVLPLRPEITGAILVVDVGTVYTRAVLFNTVDGEYRLIGRGRAPTTAFSPWLDIMVGVGLAVGQIAESTGHTLIDNDGILIMPERGPFLGVNAFAATSSAGEPIKAILVGLMPSVSVDSGRRIAASSYLLLVDVFSLSDRRSQEKQVDAMVEAKPDLVLIVGGTDGGAKNSLLNQVETIATASALMDVDQQPAILYAGNKELIPAVTDLLEEELALIFFTADNVRPTLEVETLTQAQEQMISLFNTKKSANTSGFSELRSWTEDGVLPTSQAFNRAIEMMGRLNDENVLGIDLASSAVTVSAYINGEAYLTVFDDLGTGHSVEGVLDKFSIKALTRWLSTIPENSDDIRDIIRNRVLFPHTVPITHHETEIEYAIAREMIRRTVTGARQIWRGVSQEGFLPNFDTIILAGASLANAPHYGWSAMTILDSLLPTKPIRILLDPYAMTASLGAIAPISPGAFVQMLDTGGFIDLGMTYSLTGRVRRGEVAVQGSIEIRGAGEPELFEVKAGEIISLDIPNGQTANLILQARRGVLNTGSKKDKFAVIGGELGVIIDARGRPWRFPQNHEKRCDWLKGWQETMIGKNRND